VNGGVSLRTDTDHRCKHNPKLPIFSEKCGLTHSPKSSPWNP
jgi:hypothetical protein